MSSSIPKCVYLPPGFCSFAEYTANPECRVIVDPCAGVLDARFTSRQRRASK